MAAILDFEDDWKDKTFWRKNTTKGDGGDGERGREQKLESISKQRGSKFFWIF